MSTRPSSLSKIPATPSQGWALPDWHWLRSHVSTSSWESPRPTSCFPPDLFLLLHSHPGDGPATLPEARLFLPLPTGHLHQVPSVTSWQPSPAPSLSILTPTGRAHSPLSEPPPAFPDSDLTAFTPFSPCSREIFWSSFSPSPEIWSCSPHLCFNLPSGSPTHYG